jgi:hypothetical protein
MERGIIITTIEYPELKNLDPFFDIVQKGLDGLVDGEHFFMGMGTGKVYVAFNNRLVWVV